MRIVDLGGEIEFWRTTSDSRLGQYSARPFQSTGGLLRPALVIQTFERTMSNDSIGMEFVKRAALAAEIAHCGSLVHDDIIDNDILRRGQESIFGSVGSERAILCGDALLFRVFSLLSEDGVFETDTRAPALMLRVVSELATLGHSLCDGVFAELDASDTSPTLRDTLSIADRKTARFFEASCRIGCVLSGADDEELLRYSEAGWAFGMAFQLYDDLLPIIDNGNSGKPVDSDERNKRPSFCRIKQWERLPGISDQVAERLGLTNIDAVYRIGSSDGAIAALVALMRLFESHALSRVEFDDLPRVLQNLLIKTSQFSLK